MKYFILLFTVCLISCSNVDNKTESQKCLDSGGIPFWVYDSNNRPEKIACIKL